MKLALFDHLKSTAASSKNFVSSLIGDVAGTVAEALEELAMTKADKSVNGTFTLPVSGWNKDSANGYPYYYDIAGDTTATDQATVIFDLNSLNMAKTCGICPVIETVDGAIRIRSAAIPAAAMSGEYWIEKGE